MMHISKTAVFLRPQHFVLILKYNRCTRISRKMTNWESEKRKYLTMNLEDRRKLYKTYVKIEDIPTWKQYAGDKKLLPKIDVLQGCEIDKSKNDLLINKISYYCGDITHLEIDAIVNAANSTLLGGGGVDGAIHAAAGPSLKQECMTLGGCPTGEAKITGGYKLPAKYVIHTVGPRGEKTGDLRNCYNNSLKLMTEYKLKTLAFPCISTGIYGYPNLPAAHVAAYTIRKYLEANENDVERIIFCLFMDEDKKIYEGLLQSYFPLN
ncbi:macro domain-containing protein CT2219-like [Diorhabda sublineata]|uniref:macro domain-containing protein CT2219-like n=1 Tax=Diorhabda sublineata TaxID=1163346 RepID=UPI0024E13429|nr:macro domain-containing protein CT2219-like [Diorhabda sublineata]